MGQEKNERKWRTEMQENKKKTVNRKSESNQRRNKDGKGKNE